MTGGTASELFSYRATVERWLRFEIALAEAEAAHGLIPADAAAQIAAITIDDLNLERMGADSALTRHAIVPFVRVLSAVAGAGGEYVHWGSTSQDALDVGKVLAIQEADRRMRQDIARLLSALCDLAGRHRATLMPGRTAGQFATPITFGGKVAGWADELVREMRAFDAIREVVLAGQLGGTTGQLAILGAEGLLVRDDLCARLELSSPGATWHTARDRVVRWAFHCAMVGGALGRMAAEIMHLQRSEIAEVAEPFGSAQVGSSAMPHKRNPTITATLMAGVTMIEAEFGAALSTWRGLHERDKSQFGVEDEYLPSITVRTLDLIPRMIEVVENLSVDVDTMGADLELDGRSVWSEVLLYRVAETHGRTTAHELIRNASDAWRPGRDLPELLANDPLLGASVDPEDLPGRDVIVRMLDVSGRIVDQVVADTQEYLRGAR